MTLICIHAHSQLFRSPFFPLARLEGNLNHVACGFSIKAAKLPIIAYCGRPGWLQYNTVICAAAILATADEEEDPHRIFQCPFLNVAAISLPDTGGPDSGFLKNENSNSWIIVAF